MIMIYMLVGFVDYGFVEFWLNFKDGWSKIVWLIDVGCKFCEIVILLFDLDIDVLSVDFFEDIIVEFLFVLVKVWVIMDVYWD